MSYSSKLFQLPNYVLLQSLVHMPWQNLPNFWPSEMPIFWFIIFWKCDFDVNIWDTQYGLFDICGSIEFVVFTQGQRELFQSWYLAWKNRVTRVGFEKCWNRNFSIWAFFSADKANPGFMDFFQALNQLWKSNCCTWTHLKNERD